MKRYALAVLLITVVSGQVFAGGQCGGGSGKSSTSSSSTQTDNSEKKDLAGGK